LRWSTEPNDKAHVIVIGGGLGGVAAALATARMERAVVVTDETKWIGGQATTQGVPLDEHPWIEEFGGTHTHRAFRTSVRNFYRRNYSLTAAAKADPLFDPGAGWDQRLLLRAAGRRGRPARDARAASLGGTRATFDETPPLPSAWRVRWREA
jgi:phytoene dehydrogenase-like protein